MANTSTYMQYKAKVKKWPWSLAILLALISPGGLTEKMSEQSRRPAAEKQTAMHEPLRQPAQQWQGRFPQ